MSSFSAELSQEANAIQRKIKQFVKQTQEDLVTRLKEVTPVDSGNLRDSWRMETDGEGNGEIVNDAEYATFVNEKGRLFVDKVDLIVREANAAPPEEL